MPQSEEEISFLLPQETGAVTFQRALSHEKTIPTSCFRSCNCTLSQEMRTPCYRRGYMQTRELQVPICRRARQGGM